MTLEELVGPSRRLSAAKPWNFTLEGLSGRTVEFSEWKNAAGVSLAVPLIQECQSQGLPCAWIVPRSSGEVSLFFPPDFHEAGIDCARIPILWAADGADALGIAESLLRSGGFGMVMVDLTEVRAPRRGAVGRLQAQARRYGSLALLLTRKPPEAPSLDPMVFIHLHAESHPYGPGSYTVDAVITKDKLRSPGRRIRRIYGSPPGLH